MKYSIYFNYEAFFLIIFWYRFIVKMCDYNIFFYAVFVAVKDSLCAFKLLYCIKYFLLEFRHDSLSALDLLNFSISLWNKFKQVLRTILLKLENFCKLVVVF